ARLALVAADLDDLAAKRDRAVELLVADRVTPARLPAGIHYQIDGAGPGRIGFLFPGQGSQYPGMGAELAIHFPPARAVWDDAALVGMGDRPLHRVVFPTPAIDAAEREAQDALLTATEWAQPALAAQSLALLRVLAALRVRPDCAAGHSFGELVALHVAGVLDAEALLRLARRRGELMRDTAEDCDTAGGLRHGRRPGRDAGDRLLRQRGRGHPRPLARRAVDRESQRAAAGGRRRPPEGRRGDRAPAAHRENHRAAVERRRRVPQPAGGRC